MTEQRGIDCLHGVTANDHPRAECRWIGEIVLWVQGHHHAVVVCSCAWACSHSLTPAMAAGIVAAAEPGTVIIRDRDLDNELGFYARLTPDPHAAYIAMRSALRLVEPARRTHLRHQWYYDRREVEHLIPVLNCAVCGVRITYFDHDHRATRIGGFLVCDRTNGSRCRYDVEDLITAAYRIRNEQGKQALRNARSAARVAKRWAGEMAMAEESLLSQLKDSEHGEA